MKDYKEDRANRVALTLLFAGIVFVVMFLAILIVGGLLYVLVRLGILSPDRSTVNGPAVIGLMILLNLIVGAIMAYLFGRGLMRPVNRVINGMNRLAAGDFRTRISFPGILERHPTVRELTDSFNTMASELESTEMLRSDFINHFSHEFKTPIVSIAGFAKLLRRGKLNAAETEEYLEIIETESLRLSRMATNVLNLTKIENQTILTDVTRFNLSEQLRDCVLLLESKWEQKQLKLNVEFNEYAITGNEALLKQAWINLLDNAIKFSPEGGVLDLNAKAEKSWIIVTIGNTGPEIPLESRERIFQKFYQSDISHAMEGNGVGLAIVKRVVMLHGGTISVDSQKEHTVFTVSLPNK